MRNFTIGLVLLVSFFGYSQKENTFVNKKVDDFITNLSFKGIEKIIVSDAYTNAMDAYNDNCLSPFFEKVDINSITNYSDYLVYFVVWASQDKVFLKKFDFCSEYEVISFYKEELVLNINNANLNSIYKEEILPNQDIEGDIVYSKAVTCEAPTELFFYSQEFKFSKRIYYNDLSSESNMNYGHNKVLDIIKLDRLLTEAITQIEAEGEFLSKK